MSEPFFSIVLCTRNRPDVLEHVLFSLVNQSFCDFEVILSDNSDPEFREANLQLSRKYYLKGLKYITPNRMLNMHDHYNFAIQNVSGQYISILTDKNILRKDALLNIHDILNKEYFDILNYQHAGCLWYPKNFWKWVSSRRKSPKNFELEVFSPEEELRRRFSFKYNRSRSGKYYNFGKLFFGFYHRSLVQKIEKKYEKLFHPLSPDYTSTVLALSLSKTAAYYPKEIMFAINNYLGTGAKGGSLPGYTEKFLRSLVEDFESFIQELPIPNVYASHNLCAYDYEVLKRFGNEEYHLDLNNLALRVAEDLKIFPYKSEEERIKLECYFNDFCKKRNINIVDEEIGKIEASRGQKTYPLNSLIRFLRQDGRLQKLKTVSNDFFATRHRTLNNLLDS